MTPKAFKQLASAFSEGVILISTQGDIIQFNDVVIRLLPDLVNNGRTHKNINVLSADLDSGLVVSLNKLIRSNQLMPLPAKLFNPLLKSFYFEGMRFQCDDAQGHLYLMYQPIVDLRSGQITKAETLVRWCHETRGRISPAEFIPIAEESGLIVPLGEWVFETAIQKAKQLDEAIGRTLQISINQSARQFQDFGGRYRSFAEMINEHAVLGEMICIEITEHTLFSTKDEALQILKQLRQSGVEVALEDFGTGYSSLSYLKKLDIDILKIDRGFVSQLQAGNDDQVVCEAIILMAHKLGLKVVAEGIETAEQLSTLTAIGCDYGQGYYLSRPLHEQDLLSFIQHFDYAALDQMTSSI